MNSKSFVHLAVLEQVNLKTKKIFLSYKFGKLRLTTFISDLVLIEYNIIHAFPLQGSYQFVKIQVAGIQLLHHCYPSYLCTLYARLPYHCILPPSLPALSFLLLIEYLHTYHSLLLHTLKINDCNQTTLLLCTHT